MPLTRLVIVPLETGPQLGVSRRLERRRPLEIRLLRVLPRVRTVLEVVLPPQVVRRVTPFVLQLEAGVHVRAARRGRAVRDVRRRPPVPLGQPLRRPRPAVAAHAAGVVVSVIGSVAVHRGAAVLGAVPRVAVVRVVAVVVGVGPARAAGAVGRLGLVVARDVDRRRPIVRRVQLGAVVARRAGLAPRRRVRRVVLGRVGEPQRTLLFVLQVDELRAGQHGATVPRRPVVRVVAVPRSRRVFVVLVLDGPPRRQVHHFRPTNQSDNNNDANNNTDNFLNLQTSAKKN